MGILWPLLVVFGEVWLLVELGSVLPSLLLIAIGVATFAIGLWSLRRGLSRSARLMERARGEVRTVMTPLGYLVLQRRAGTGPDRGALLEALGLVLAGGLLMVPGLATDLIGLALLIAPVRRGLIERVYGFRARSVASGASAPREAVWSPSRARPNKRAPTVDVDVLPPGALPNNPFRKRPVVIDVE
jgi:UPF0716 protein FxsA